MSPGYIVGCPQALLSLLRVCSVTPFVRVGLEQDLFVSLGHLQVRRLPSKAESQAVDRRKRLENSDQGAPRGLSDADCHRRGRCYATQRIRANGYDFVSVRLGGLRKGWQIRPDSPDATGHK